MSASTKQIMLIPLGRHLYGRLFWRYGLIIQRKVSFHGRLKSEKYIIYFLTLGPR